MSRLPPARPRRWLPLAAAALLLACTLGSGALAPVGTTLAAEAAPRRADAIVLTYGAMMVPDGVAEAARLYDAGFAGTIALSDFRIEQRGWGVDRTQPLARRWLLRRGVPADALVALPTVPGNELAEAQALRELIAARGWRSVLLVARDYRLLRTVGTLRHALGPDVDLIARPVHEQDVDLPRWWTTREGLFAVLNEWARVSYYRLLGRL